MEFKLNFPFEVQGNDLREYLTSHDNKYQATYHVDPNVTYRVLIWLDSEKYDIKTKILDDYGQKKRKSAHIIDGAAFYILMFSPLSHENLEVAPTAKEPEKKKPELSWEIEKKEKAQKVLDIITEPMVTKKIAEKSGMSYVSILKIMKFLLQKKLVIRKAPEGWKFGESRPELHYHKIGDRVS